MDVPQPPSDEDQRRIIDKLAQFVARNGADFENMTKAKQKDNPKFNFLFGGEWAQYYMYKVTTEQAILRHKEQIASSAQKSCESHAPPGIAATSGQQTSAPYHLNSLPSGVAGDTVGSGVCAQFSVLPPNIPPPQTATLDRLTQEMQELTDRISESEKNLSAQREVLVTERESTCEHALISQHAQLVHRAATELGVCLDDFDRVLKPIVDTCTKDSISHGKQWIFSQAVTDRHCDVIARHLCQRVIQNETDFSAKLHMIYLLNDVLHHCMRKNMQCLRECLEAVVVPMFARATIVASAQNHQKLEKLFTLWESKTGLFTPELLRQLKDAPNAWLCYKQRLASQLADPHTDQMLAECASDAAKYEQYKQQHENYVRYTLQQIEQLQLQYTAMVQQQQHRYQAAGNNQPPFTVDFTRPPPGYYDAASSAPTGPVYPSARAPVAGSAGATPSDDPALVPSLPYYQLPAGLMVPLVGLCDHKYRPLDPAKLRHVVPPKASVTEFGNDHIMLAIEAFYATPERGRFSSANSKQLRVDTIANRRDKDGWEQLGLYEFYRAKNSARKQNSCETEGGEGANRQHHHEGSSRSPTPCNMDDFQLSPEPRAVEVERRYSSVSPERDSQHEGGCEGSRGTRRSPVTRSSRRNADRSERSDRFESRSERSDRSERFESRSERSERLSRAISPQAAPSMMNFSAIYEAPNCDQASRLDESNKGHQLLKAMGWSGAGLGSQEQGIFEPISGGHVRDKQDQYKGVGIDMHDPFENFRKSKGQAFIHRMRNRGDVPEGARTAGSSEDQ